MTERRIRVILATAGTALTLAGALMYVLPGPGFPVLVIGLAALITGLVMAATTLRN
ncbi:PGPGW domain-containing protein [Streptomyces griseoincarnatus]